MKLLTKIFGSRNDRILRNFRQHVQKINQLEGCYATLSDEALRGQTVVFQQRFLEGESLESLLPEAFAVVREASQRVFSLRPFDVQLMGGMVLNQRAIAEMRTGEGKTLTSTLPAYLNALTGKGVHIVTVNEYLARRDARDNGKLFGFLGLTVGLTLHGMSPREKRTAYQADIIYGTNSEFCFDYLRDNMVYSKEERAQRPLYYALLDEVDSILIDEARTPLIISDAAEKGSQLCVAVDKLIPLLTQQAQEDSEEFQGEGHFYIDEKAKQAHWTERGQLYIEELLVRQQLLQAGDSLYASHNLQVLHRVQAALRAHALYVRNVHYIVKDEQILIVDEHTGRAMPGRRWSEGLHQALEAKEQVPIQEESQTLASISYQNYFRLYPKLAGMTGTAETEAFEFKHIYGLETIVIPTNRPMIRIDYPDRVYLTESEKFDAIVEEIQACVETQRPVLVGTISIEKSEQLSARLKAVQIKHTVLNAKFHLQEAEIIAQAGNLGSVTIATNMAGRGTDIVLGGNLQGALERLDESQSGDRGQLQQAWEQRHQAVLALGGLHVIGTERHESRRIDNQLRGRAGRQGDSGSSRFYLSFEDALMRIFFSPRIANFVRRSGLEQGEAIELPMMTRQIANAQKKVESHHFDARKQLLEYDDVANEQRQIIYKKRNLLLDAENVRAIIEDMRENVLSAAISEFVLPNSSKAYWNIEGLTDRLRDDFALALPLERWVQETAVTAEVLKERILQAATAFADRKDNIFGKEKMQAFEKAVMLQILDLLWKEHLSAMDHLMKGIHLRSYAQKDPKQEYKREAFDMFVQLCNTLNLEVSKKLSHAGASLPEDLMPAPANDVASPAALTEQATGSVSWAEQGPTELFHRFPIGRNTPCPCGSRQKYKYCHGSPASSGLE